MKPPRGLEHETAVQRIHEGESRVGTLPDKLLGGLHRERRESTLSECITSALVEFERQADGELQAFRPGRRPGKAHRESCAAALHAINGRQAGRIGGVGCPVATR
ncbi:MAG: hypothetical protein K0R17_410 [Rariglobus sp.]|nr:hypothetical protein [Rariglobus sp.]